jgi:hypothetical protein
MVSRSRMLGVWYRVCIDASGGLTIDVLEEAEVLQNAGARVSSLATRLESMWGDGPAEGLHVRFACCVGNEPDASMWSGLVTSAGHPLLGATTTRKNWRCKTERCAQAVCNGGRAVGGDSARIPRG